MRTELFGLCLILLVCSSIASDVDRCPSYVTRDTYLQTHGDRCYRFVTYQKRTWNDAQSQCYHAHGRLVEIPDQATNDFIHSTLKEMHYSEEGVWIGFNDKYHEGTWLWESGKPGTFQNWAANQQGSGIGHNFEDCGLLDMDDGKWHDYSCSLFIDHFGYICMYDMMPSTAALTTRTTKSATMTTLMASQTTQPTTATASTPKIPHTTAPSTAAPTTTKAPTTAAPTTNTTPTTTKAPTTAAPTTTPVTTQPPTTKPTPMKTDAPSTTSKPGCVPLDDCGLVCDKTGYVKDNQGCDICMCIS